tara:strand:+ start:37 stop:339 length:303 start_codon:yes stop_codon:yes gene_type:complete
MEHEQTVETVEAEVVDTVGNAPEKTILLLNDSHDYQPYTTKATNVNELVSELNLDASKVVVRAGGSDVIDFTDTDVQSDEFYSLFTRNKTGGKTIFDPHK